MNLANLRRTLAEARISLRQAKDTYEVARAIAEQRAIDQLNGSAGKNEAERSRNLTIVLASDGAYSDVLLLLRSCEAEVDRLNAEIAVEEDALSQQRLAEREHNDRAIERLATALEATARLTPSIIASTLDNTLF